MNLMTKQVPVIDLFSGPGGLSEGFSPCSVRNELRRYKIVLSVEKERYAYETLLLRAFLRQFTNGLPPEYYEFLNTHISEPDWHDLYPNEWLAARQQTKMLELGNRTAKKLLSEKIKDVKNEHGNRLILVGGPPCQAYSIASRYRSSENDENTDGDDPRIYLYKQYVKFVTKLNPAIAVMENVKGILSMRFEGKKIFPTILDKLRNASGVDSYQIFSITPISNSPFIGDSLASSEFVVRAENHGVPQTRHRVFIVCIRRDIAESLPTGYVPQLVVQNENNSVANVIGSMPRIRSGLSRTDNSVAWRTAIQNACDKVEQNMPNMSHREQKVFLAAVNRSRKSIKDSSLDRTASGCTTLPDSCPKDLRSWIYDSYLEKLPNNETRGHMPSDLERYIYAAAFAATFVRSPKTSDFPRALASNHKSWYTNKFADRFRVQLANFPSKTITSHIAKDGHYFIHPDPSQCRSLTVREAARLQTFPDNYLFKGNRTEQYVQVGNAVPPYLAYQIADCLWKVIEHYDHESLCKKHDRETNLGVRKAVYSESAL